MERALTAVGISVLVAALHVATRARRHLGTVVPVAGPPVLFFAGRDSALNSTAAEGDDRMWGVAAGLVEPLFASLAVVAVLVVGDVLWHRRAAERALHAEAEAGVPMEPVLYDAGEEGAPPVLVARLAEERAEGVASAPDLRA